MMCLFICDNDVVAVKFNSQGESILKSSLVVDEELDIIENYYNLDTIDINYKINSVDKINFRTLKEQNILKYLDNHINQLDIVKDRNKIKYLFFECFGLMEDNSSKALAYIKQNYINHSKLMDLYNFFKLIEQN